MADYKEFFIYCKTCKVVTHMACMKTGDGVSCECMECETDIEYDSWDDVIGDSEEDD